MARPVKILALGFRGIPEQKIYDTITAEAAFNPDLVVLPEAFLGDDYPRDKCDAVLKNAADCAKRLKTWFICPLYRYKDAAHTLNSAFVFNREGELVAEYNKIFPWWFEFTEKPSCEPGNHLTVVDTDFGKIGIAICFDVNFPVVWKKMEEAGAELVVWPSDYSAGRALQAHAMMNHYYIVSATRVPDSAVYDISGDELRYCRNDGMVINKTTLDLDRSIYHTNFNFTGFDEGKLKKLLEKYPDISVEKIFDRESWFILSSKNQNVDVKKAASEFGLEELRAYIRRSGTSINPVWA
jgi:predicted amidohydrolase